VQNAKRSFDPKTGRFLAENGGWAVTRQDVIWPLAVLYTAEERGNSCRGRKDILKLCCRGGDALCDWMNPDGTFVFMKVDGSTWGDIYMCWTMYHWLEAYVLLEPHLDAARRRRWAKHLRRTFSGVADRYRRSGFRVHNIPAWHAVGMILAAKVFGQPRWAEEGARYLGQVADHQHPDGYWPEGGGPTTAYNMVYVHAMGLNYLLTGDRRALRALQRAAAFHGHFTYPDGSAVETVDGRVKYHEGAGSMGLVGLCLTPEGRGLLGLKLEKVLGRRRQGGLNVHLATLWKHLSEGAVVPPLQKQKSAVAVHPPRGARGLVRRRGPWFVCLSGYLTPRGERAANSLNRWYMDRQQHVSLWHEALGLVVGGGNSKFQPDRSTFAVWSGGHCRHEADGARLSKGRESGDGIVLRYGRQECRLNVRIIGPQRAELTFSAPRVGRREVLAGFLLRVSAGGRIRTSRRPRPAKISPTEQVTASWPEGGRGPRWLEAGNLRVIVPAGAFLYWPQYPFNPYAIDGAAPAGDAAAHVGIALRRGRTRAKFVIEVGPGKRRR
jgi:hypothetical protein